MGAVERDQGEVGEGGEESLGGESAVERSRFVAFAKEFGSFICQLTNYFWRFVSQLYTSQYRTDFIKKESQAVVMVPHVFVRKTLQVLGLIILFILAHTSANMFPNILKSYRNIKANVENMERVDIEKCCHWKHVTAEQTIHVANSRNENSYERILIAPQSLAD